MTYGIGARIFVINGQLFLRRWIYPLEQGTITGKHTSPAGQEVYDVLLDKDGEKYSFRPADMEELKPAP